MLFFIIAFFLFFYVYIKRMIRDSFSKKVILSFWTIWFISLVISTFNPYGLYPVSDEVYVIMLLNVSAIILGFSSVKVNKNICLDKKVYLYSRSLNRFIYSKKIFNNTFCVYHFIRKSPRKILECSIIYESCRS